MLDLVQRQTWDIVSLLMPTPAELWGQQQLVRLGALVQVHAARSEAQDDEPVITPGGVDSTTGAVATRRGRAANRSVLRVGAVDAAAQLGDVLVPQFGDGPCVLIGEQHKALSFVNFVALRPETRTVGLWLWAVLSATRGQWLRQALAVGTTRRLSLTDLLNSSVPVPPADDDPRYDQISTLHAGTTVGDSSEGRSWWRVATLPADGEWHRHLVTPTPEMLEHGTPLGQLAVILAGRNPALVFESSRPGSLPVLNGRSVDGAHVTRWADPGSTVIAEPGDVAVVEVGVRGRAAIVGERAIAGTGVLLLKPHDRSHGSSLAAYLRSESAQNLRGTLIAGFIPRLTRSTLRQLPVPDEALAATAHAPAEQDPAFPLGEQLERLLWT